MTRIGIIREAIEAEGGNRISSNNRAKQYYADGPNIHASRQMRLKKEANYKIDKAYDGLTEEARKRVVLALRNHPMVKDAYLSRPYNGDEGHLKVVFQN